MGNETIALTHIALYVTDLTRSIPFYRDILHMTVSDPISLKEQSTGLRYGHSLITHGPSVVRNLISRAKPAAYQHMFTDICHCSTADGTVSLILVQQTHPEKGYTRSVTGNTVYGFSCHLSPDIDLDDLAWDMDIADIPFQHGDTGTDGLEYSLNAEHSLFIRDPDGRMIELVPSSKNGEFLTGIKSAFLYVNDIQASKKFYTETCGLTDITPPAIAQKDWKKSIIWMGTPGGTPVLVLYQVMNPDGTRIEAGGYGLDHLGLSGISKGKETISEPGCVTIHPPRNGGFSTYLEDPDGYLIEMRM
ncbi:MAG: VOC family protein [Methanospirillum sp.]|uniref:VOC family protein n=1 Tax=Methanospirillum sp. TaxID=45200 RepID=UPI00236EE41C|nr:VOC family protein [Methanospirillum sp.]MDD1728703.1 VOC family protein [Methanospirillum sp.]